MSTHSSSSGVSGLGITFHPTALQQHTRSETRDGPIPQHSNLAPPRPLRHSMSFDNGVKYYSNYQQDMLYDDNTASLSPEGLRVPISATHMNSQPHKDNGLHYYQPTQLSPLSEFDPTSESDSNVDFEYSPASLSSLPSSINSAAAYRHTFYQHTPHAQLRHAQSLNNLQCAAAIDAEPDSVKTDYYAYHKPGPNQEQRQQQQQQQEHIHTHTSRSSRLPQFLKDRKQQHQGAADRMRPQSMMELNQLYNAHAHGADRAPEQEEDAYCVSSPNESVPSSAGGLQRRRLEKQLEDQHRLLQQEKKRLTKSSVDRQGSPNPASEKERRQNIRQRSRSMCATDRLPRTATEIKEGEERPRAARPKSDRVDVAERASGDIKSESARDAPSTCSKELSTSSGPSGLARQSTLLTSGANPARRSKELDRLLAPNAKKSAAVANMPVIAGSPTPSSSAPFTPSTRAPLSESSSRAMPIALGSSPIMLEQGQTASKARVELDLLLASSVVVEGGVLKGSLEVRVRRPRDVSSEVWVGYPKIRVVGFEELSTQDVRHIFYHHSNYVTSIEDSKQGSTPLPCFESDADEEGFSRGRVGQHKVPFKLILPVGKGAKGSWKAKQGAVRYIVIASTKLKSRGGQDRSIAHFYRHIEVYPYLNPAVLLAPALKPLRAQESKSLFMGGSGKVKLSAEMHRATWVAGQACYVDICVENETSKKIKSLTLSLVRTTTLFRPYEDMTAANQGSDANACQSTSTKKKIAETTLEMGKKGTSGVTAKGSWIGVDAGETAEFAHFLLIPHDALSIPRGRHVEVSFAVKVSVGGSLSADVSTEIPIRIVNFISLDPPPGHTGDNSSSTTSPRPLAKRWSTNQLRDTSNLNRMEAVRQISTITRMSSMDSLRLQDLNLGSAIRGAPALSRIPSVDTIKTIDLSRAQSIVAPPSISSVPISHEDVPGIQPSREQAVVGKARERQLTHQMSLECISSAIASATARRQGHQRTQSGLRSIASSAEVETWEEPASRVQQQQQQPYRWSDEMEYEDEHGPRPLQLDDLDDVPDEIAEFDLGADAVDDLHKVMTTGGHHSAHELKDEDEEEDFGSDLELNVMMQSKFSDDDEEEEDLDHKGSMHSCSTRSQSMASAMRPSSRLDVSNSTGASYPNSPVKTEQIPKSAMRRSDMFAFATPTSPVKANVELPVPKSPLRSQTASPSLDNKATRRPLPPRPDASPSFSSPTKASSARDAIGRAELTKKPSTTSLKRTAGVTRRASSKSLASDAAADAQRSMSPTKLSPSLQAAQRSPLPPKSPRASPSISVTASSLIAPPASPRKIKVAPVASLRSARSMHELRTGPLPQAPQRKPTMVPSVRTKIAALETRQATLQRLTSVHGRAVAGGTADLNRANSVASSVSEVSFAGLHRADSLASFKAPLLRRKVHDPMP